MIGSGPGRYVAAIRAAQLGMKTVVVEKDRVGGHCLTSACIPAKAVLRVADVLSEVRDANEFGIKVTEPESDYVAVHARREKVIKTLTAMVKIVGEKKSDELLGGHIVGAKATELIQELVSVRALGGGYPKVARLTHSHPTLVK